MRGKIKIGFLIDTISSDMAGTEKQLLGVLARLNRETFEPHLVCLRSSPWLERQKRLSCHVSTLGYQGLLKSSFPAVVRRFVEVIEQQELQVVQTFFEDAKFVGVLGAGLSRRRPVLLASRRDLGLGAEEPWYHHLYRLVRPVLNSRFDGMVVNAEAVRSHVITVERFPARRVIVIPNGVELPTRRRRPEIFAATRADLRIVTTANLKPIKRIDILLKALAAMQNSCADLNIRAYLLGEGALQPVLTRMAEDLRIDRMVHFLGARDDVFDFLLHADVGVLCSDREGLSNAILEYMACGLPVVATRVGGNSELVDSANGILVPPDDPQGLAQALGRLANSQMLRKRMGQRSLARIRQLHLWEQVMPQWENYYARICPQ